MALALPSGEPSLVVFIRRVGVKLGLEQDTIASSQVFFLKFCKAQSLDAHDGVSVACTCVFLACKVAEQPRRIRDVLNCSHDVLNPGAPPMKLDHAYSALKDAIVLNEQLVLRSLAFDTDVPLPYRYLLNYGKTLRVSNVVVQLAIGLVNDTIFTTHLVLTAQPNVIAAAALYVAMRLAKEDYKLPTGRLAWWQAFGTTTTEVNAVGTVMMRTIAKHVEGSP